MRTDTRWLSQLWICPFSSIDTHSIISAHEFGVYTLVEVLGKYSPVGGIKCFLPAASRPEKIIGQLSISDDKLWECYDFGAVNIFHMCSLQHRWPGWTSAAWFVALPEENAWFPNLRASTESLSMCSGQVLLHNPTNSAAHEHASKKMWLGKFLSC